MSQSRVLDLLRESPGAVLRTYSKNLDSKVYFLRPANTADFQVFELGSLRQSMCDFVSCAHFILLEENSKLGSFTDSLSYSLTHEVTMTEELDVNSTKTAYQLSLPFQLQRTIASREIATLKIAEGAFGITHSDYDRIPPPHLQNNIRWSLVMRAQHGFTRPLLRIEEVRDAAIKAGISAYDLDHILTNARMMKGVQLPERYDNNIPAFVPLIGNALERVVTVLKPANNHIFLHRFSGNDINRDIEELRCAADCVLLEQFQLLNSIPANHGLVIVPSIEMSIGSPVGPTHQRKLVPVFMEKSPDGLLNARLVMAYELFALGLEHDFPVIFNPLGIPNTTRPQVVTRRIKSLTLDISTATFDIATIEHGLIQAGPGSFARCHKDVCGSNCPNAVYKEYVIGRLQKVINVIMTRAARRA